MSSTLLLHSVLTLSLPESLIETFKVVLVFESVDEILWCDHSNETFSAALLHSTMVFVGFEKVKFKIFIFFIFTLATTRSESVNNRLQAGPS